ncbi:glycoside hydrolase family 5 protein [Exidia glandulosa HHB12029]|uniref:Glycoside hydrolase family 5 protein n=1 Tax=Exidia glandulosa HHB12029 TaxID=1314781 RepID=A0A165EKZ2_EXIGL|nr:glycoside hydrolase family 5 protein [Exidia glandulosa HHB12029]
MNDDVDSLFGSRPPSPFAAYGQGRSPAPTLALPGSSTTSTQNVGTIALPGLHGSSPSANSGPLPLFNYSTTPIRGVNLGGWFVLEPWITPSVFQATGKDSIIDEYTFGQQQDPDVALAALKTHWSTWIVEDDFAAISNAGLNHVRIPLGYWAVPQNESVAPYVSGAYPYFKTALHGQRGAATWANDPENVSRTVNIIHYLAQDVGDMIAVVQLLNEVAAYTSNTFATTVRQYWQDGYAAVRDGAGPNVQVMIGDAFEGVQAWAGFMQPPDFRGVLMDYHEYQIFSVQELQRSWGDHISYACGLGPPLASFSSSNLWTVVGEWSLAITDCTLWLNGRGVGARWDNTYYPGPGTTGLGDCNGLSMDSSKFSSDYKAFLRKYWEVQVHIGEMAKGWIFWTWKAENSDEWSYKVGLQQGWIPQDPSDRLYPDICG